MARDERKGLWSPYKLSAAFNNLAPAFRMVDDIYYVGSRRASSHLVTSDEGHVLIDTCFPEEGPFVLKGILDLGFNPKDIRFILVTHAHVDCLGSAKLLASQTGARIGMGKVDAMVAEKGSPAKMGLIRTPDTSQLYRVEFFKVDMPLEEGDVIELGDKRINVCCTPGHTPGCCSFGFKIRHENNEYNVLLFGGSGQDVFEDRTGFGYPNYQGTPEDYKKTLDRLKSFQVDVWLGAQPNQNRTFEKLELLQKGVKPNPFIDPEGWKAHLKSLEDGLRKFL